MLTSASLGPAKAGVALILGALAAASNLMWIQGDSRIAGLILAFPLAWAAVVDLERLKLPDVITLPLIAIGLAVSSAHGPASLIDHAVAALAGYMSLALLGAAYRKLRKQDGLGRGDAKLFAAAGAWLGLSALPFVMLIASAVALVAIAAVVVVRRNFDRHEPIPFGPYLAAGFWFMWLVTMGERPLSAGG